MRRTLRGVPTGRRATHEVETTYGRHQQAAERAGLFARFIAARRAQQEDQCPCCALSPDWHDDRPCLMCGHTRDGGN